MASGLTGLFEDDDSARAADTDGEPDRFGVDEPAVAALNRFE